MYNKTYEKLSAGVQTGYGDASTIDEATLAYQLKNNVAVFSAFKANHYGDTMRKLLVDENGEKRGWSSFLKEAKIIDPKYNRTWLTAEYNLAIRQARSAKQWASFERDKGVYPNLEYMPSRAAEPNEDHKKFYGLIYPIDHPFWDTFTPPSRWGCACWLKQTREEATGGEDYETVDPIPGIAGNAGKTGKVFDASHPFVSAVKKKDRAALEAEFRKLKSNKESFIQLKAGKNKVNISTNADENDLLGNTSALLPYAKKYKKDMFIPGHSFLKDVKNPELFDGKLKGDRAVWTDAKDARTFVKRNIKNKLKPAGQLAKEKGCFVLLDFDGKLTPELMPGVAGQMKGIFSNRPTLKYVIMKNGDKVYLLNKFNDLPTLTKEIALMRKEL